MSNPYAEALAPFGLQDATYTGELEGKPFFSQNGEEYTLTNFGMAQRFDPTEGRWRDCKPVIPLEWDEDRVHYVPAPRESKQ